MSRSAKGNPLRKFARGERRNAARQVAKELGRPFREVWERAYRIQPEEPKASVFSGMLNQAARFVVKHMVVTKPWRLSGFLMHPTKGWRGKDGLPLGRRAWA